MSQVLLVFLVEQIVRHVLVEKILIVLPVRQINITVWMDHAKIPVIRMNIQMENLLIVYNV
jgi:hypothetical protein